MAITVQSDSMEPVLLMHLILSQLNKFITQAWSRPKLNKHNDEGSSVFKHTSFQMHISIQPWLLHSWKTVSTKTCFFSELIFVFVCFPYASQYWTGFLKIETRLPESLDLLIPRKQKGNLLLCCVSVCWESRTSAGVHHTSKEWEGHFYPL